MVSSLANEPQLVRGWPWWRIWINPLVLTSVLYLATNREPCTDRYDFSVRLKNTRSLKGGTGGPSPSRTSKVSYLPQSVRIFLTFCAIVACVPEITAKFVSCGSEIFTLGTAKGKNGSKETQRLTQILMSVGLSQLTLESHEARKSAWRMRKGGKIRCWPFVIKITQIRPRLPLSPERFFLQT